MPLTHKNIPALTPEIDVMEASLEDGGGLQKDSYIQLMIFHLRSLLRPHNGMFGNSATSLKKVP